MTATNVPQPAPLVTRRYLVRGRVQGVGFRWFVEREANKLGVCGWVRNNEDATVELVAAGTLEQHAILAARLGQGPRAARVERVEVTDVEATALAGVTRFETRGAW